jgi:rare lipoprotein A (peptidoglycan hydrolase)
LGPNLNLPFKPRLHKRAATIGAYTLGTLAASAAGLLLIAPGSQALSGVSAQASQARSAAAPPGYRRRTASWYYDQGHQTACGFVAKYGVANKKLPCGTHVKFWRDGHSVTATVDDRGPYIAGRTWDLGQRTARRLHFQGVGVGYVWAKW